MNSFSSDQMLLPSITQILDPDVKCGPAFTLPLSQSPLTEEELALGGGVENASLRPECTMPTPKMLTPPNSPVLSELTPPTYLLKMGPHDGSQLVPDLNGNNICDNGLQMVLDTFENLIASNPGDMFEDSDSGSDWPGIYIDDIDDSSVPSPTPSPPFDAPAFYDLDVDQIFVPESGRVERTKHNSVCTDADSLHSDSGSEMSGCRSPIFSSKPFHSHHHEHGSSKSKSAGRTHNYKRRMTTKSLTELKEEGTSLLKSIPSSSSLSSSLSSSSLSSSTSAAEGCDRVPRRRGRPRKRLPGELGERDGGCRRKSGRKQVKGSHLWEFILQTLKNEAYCPQYIKWEDKDEGVFRIVNSKVVASMWGEIKNNPRMTYEKLSRAMRYYYKRQILERVDKARLVYKFGEKAEGWRNQVADD